MEEWVSQLGEYARTALRPMEGSVRADGVRERIEILTDRWGTPHVYASSLDDAYFAQGWLHAAERLWQIEFTRRLAQGRLAEIVSFPALGLDKFFRTIGIWRIAKRMARKADDRTRAIAEPYYAGFTAAATSLPRPAEYQFLDLKPAIASTLDESIVDSFSFALLMAFTLSTNWPFELLRAELARKLGPERARELTPFIGPEAPVAVPADDDFPSVAKTLREAAYAARARRGLGSNNWVVSGAKTTTGKPILCNDPHLLVQMPAIWMQMHLSCPEMDVTGVTLPGIPGVVIGHNRRIAWGFTNTQADVEDLYIERLSSDGTQYEFKGKWLPIKVIKEKIAVRGEESPVVHEVRETRHGPLLTDWIAGGTQPSVIEGWIREPITLRWIHRDVQVHQRSIEGINKARDWDEFRAAAGEWPSPGQNMVYADVDGNIGYQCTGVIPLRTKGSGAAPLPGWTGEHEWKGTIPFDDLPRTFNPARGFVATANHRLVDLDYPYYITNDWEMGHRIRRITSLLTSTERFDVAAMAAMQQDAYSGIAAELVPLFLEAPALGDREAEALKHVHAWDLMLGADSIGGTIFNAWFARVAALLFEEKLGADLYAEFYPRKAWTTNWCYDSTREILRNPQAFWVGGDGSNNVHARNELLGLALTKVCEDLSAKLGEDMNEWRWGRLHRVHFRHTLGAAIPSLDELLSAGPFEAAGGDDTINRGVLVPGEDFADAAIASYRQIIDLADFDRSLGVITTGNSGNPSSPFYKDQSELWARGEYHPMPFTRAAVEAATAHRLELTP